MALGVTIPGTANSLVFVPYTPGTNLVLAQQLAASLNAIQQSGSLSVASLTGGGGASDPPPGKVGELLIAGSVGGGISVPTSYSWVANIDSSPVTIGAANQNVFSGTVGSVIYDSGNASVAAGGGNNQIYLSGSLYFGAAGSGNDTIFGSGSGTIAGGGGTNVLSAGSKGGDSNTIFSEGVSDQVYAAAGSVTVAVATSGTNDGILATGATSLTVFNQGVGTTISASTAATTVVNSSSMVFVGGTANDTIYGANTAGVTQTVFGSSGGLTYFTGASAGTVVGGSTAPTMIGGAGGSVVYTGIVGATFLAGVGNETVNAALSSGNNFLVGGSDSTGGDNMIGGSGNDTLFAGAGAATLTGGAGGDEFAYFKATTTGQSTFIMDFTTADAVYLVGYGVNQAANALAAATTTGGSTTITLIDNTRITFVGVSSTSTLQGHIFSS